MIRIIIPFEYSWFHSPLTFVKVVNEAEFILTLEESRSSPTSDGVRCPALLLRNSALLGLGSVGKLQLEVTGLKGSKYQPEMPVSTALQKRGGCCLSV